MRGFERIVHGSDVDESGLVAAAVVAGGHHNMLMWDWMLKLLLTVQRP